MNITGGKYNSIKIKVPESDSVRPTLSKIRAGVFNSLSSLMSFENSSFLDCFAGSGIISLEAVSRGFKRVVTIEKDYKTAKIIKENFKFVNEMPNLIIKDSINVLDILKEKFDVIYLDPPYMLTDLYEKSVEKIIKNNLLNNNGIIVVECKKNNKDFRFNNKLKLIKEKTYGDTSVLYYN